MDDDAFKKEVIDRLGAIETTMVSDREHLDRRLDAVVSRLEEQDVAYDRLVEKVNRLGVAVQQSLEASEQALSAITPLARRVHKLEHPDD